MVLNDRLRAGAFLYLDRQEMKKKNKVFIARSLDGYIAGKEGEIEWLNAIPNPDRDDMGYLEFMAGIDALLMGRRTFHKVCSFDMDWPYTQPVFVWSQTLQSIPGTASEVLKTIHDKGYEQLYIDGGATIRSFLREDLIDEMIITTIPILLGGGISLFRDLPHALMFELVRSQVFLGQMVQDHYRRKRI